ncbi:MAG: response regulator [Balneolaceae bacterium]|nr:response regulator [Balneolaceae bacterium]
MDKLFQVLLVEDNSLHVKILLDYLKKIDLDISVSVVSTRNAFHKAIESNKFDLIISDYMLTDFSGLDALKMFREINEDVPFILVSSYMNETEGVEAMMNGVTDFLIKDNLRRIIPAAKRELLNYVQRRTIENSLQQSKAIITSMESNIEGFAWESSAESLKLTYLSPTFESILGYSIDEVINKADMWGNYIHPKDYYKVIEYYTNAKDNNLKEIEYRLIDSEGKVHWFRDVLTYRSDPNVGNRLQGLMVDITEIRENKEHLDRTINEKEELISELHHRVKNNLAVISSMIQLQAITEEKPEIQVKLIEGVNRIKSMAIVHDIVYNKEKFNNYSIKDGIEDLVNSVIDTFASSDNFKVNYIIDADISSIQQAIPVALILTEVVSNTVKHAYSADLESKKIDIQLSEKGNDVLSLEVRDYGKGIPDEVIKSGHSTIGISIINALSTQLDGTFYFEKAKPGTHFKLNFKKSYLTDDSYSSHY